MPSERLKGSTMNISCLSEELLRMSGLFRLEHDVRGDGDNPKFFTRVYRLILDGQPTKHTVRFKYDYRDNKASVSTSKQTMTGLQEALETIRNKKC